MYSILYSFGLNILFTNFIAIAGIILLKDKTLFNVPEEKIGQYTTDLFFYPLPLTMAASLFMGYIYDKKGRKGPLFVFTVTASVVTMLLLDTAPSFIWLLVLLAFL